MAAIKTYHKDGIEFIGANNLLINNPAINDSELIIRYKNPKTDKVIEDTIVPYDMNNEEHKRAIFAFWQVLKDSMKKAEPEEDLNPFKIMNSRGFRGKLRGVHEEQQMSLFASKLDDMADLLENKGYIKEAYRLDVISNSLLI